MPKPTQRRTSESGFSVVELLVAFTIVVIVMTIVYLTLDLNSNIARVQVSVSELQQSLRYGQREMARRVRMTGRSGLPRPLAIAVQQNVPAGTAVAGVDVVEGTDVLTIRGSFSSPIFRVDAGDATTFQITGSTAQVIVDSVTKSGFSQPVDALLDAGAEDALVIVSRQADAVWAVVELASVSVEQGLAVEIQNQTITVDRATLTVNIEPGTGTHTADYLALSAGGVFPPNLTSALFVAVLEEYRYFVQEEFSVPGDRNSLATPKLVLARMTPGTELVYQGDAALASQDIAENVLDLQVALGIDLDGDGRILAVEDEAGNPVTDDVDEWLYNHADDDDTLPWDLAPLQYLRVSMLARTTIPDRQYISPPIIAHLDRQYGEAAVPSVAGLIDRRFRRRQLENLIDLRNI